LKASDIDTVVTGRSTGHPVRALRNKLSREFAKREKEGASVEELEALGAGGLRLAVVEGDVINGTVMSGQIAGMIKQEQTAKEMIEEIMTEGNRVLAQIG
ncbi:MAG: nitronate monooxygenase, partial [Zhenhengia sp.]